MLEITGTATVADIVAVADGEPVRVPDAAVEAVRRAHAAAHRLSAKTPTYGRTTGVGANKSELVDDDDHGLRLLRSHAVDAGEELPARAARAMLAVRLNQLCVPGSGVAPQVLRGLERMLAEDALPTVRAHASIGTGDLGPLAGTALTLMGERPATRPLEPMGPWGRDSALPFISSSALTLGRTCLVVDALERLDRAAAVVYALTFLGLEGNPSVLTSAAVRAAAAPGVTTVANRVRRLLAGREGVRPARIQDAYGLRVFPISQGAFTHALEVLAGQAGRLVAVAQENPLFDLDGAAVVHHGAFHQVALGLALDGCTLALAQTAPLVVSRIGMLNEPALTGERPFLAVGPEGASGLMMVEYVAASAVAELRAAAQPASLGTVVLSRGAEEDASFASQAVVQAERAVTAYRLLLACELVGAVRLLRQRGVEPPAGPLREAVRLAGALPAEGADRELRGDLDTAQSLLDELAEV